MELKHQQNEKKMKVSLLVTPPVHAQIDFRLFETVVLSHCDQNITR